MNAVVKSVDPGSRAAKAGITPGYALRRINGNKISDVLDYMYYSYDSRLLLEFRGTDGKLKLVELHKPEGADPGINFDSFLMDKPMNCANKCVFCFIDQLPSGLRESLYYKDDDVRLSFLQGNYVTLTNLSVNDVDRIVRLRISPLNVSVHTLDPALRTYMLGSKRAAAGVDALAALARAGIALNCQIVCCPGINDGAALNDTMEGLYRLGSGVNSVSVVPVGLTKHRSGLPALRPYDLTQAAQTIRQVSAFSEKCLRRRGSRMFFCADELYMMAGLRLPAHEFYEDYPQLENGVGMMRLLITEFERALGKSSAGAPAGSEPFSVATGALAGKYLTNLLKRATEKYGNICGKVYTIRNDFFGGGVTVSGLITGGDIAGQLKGRDLGSRLLIPRNMLRHGGDVFLDDVTVAELSSELRVPVRAVEQDGADLLKAFLEE